MRFHLFLPHQGGLLDSNIEIGIQTNEKELSQFRVCALEKLQPECPP